MTPARWQILLFGPLEARSGDRVILRFRTRKAASLLAYLAYNPGRAHTRDSLVELLWPDSDPRAGRGSLRMELSWLRRQLEPPEMLGGSVLVTVGETVLLNPEYCTTDVTRFAQLLAEAHEANLHEGGERVALLNEALTLYRGDLLSGLYDDWVVRERDAQFDLYVDAMGRLAKIHLDAGDLREARDIAARSVRLDMLRADSHAALMRAHIALGRPDLAREDFDLYARCLRDQLGEDPDPELAGLVAGVPASQRATRQVPLPASSPLPQQVDSSLDLRLQSVQTRFFGRAAELAHITSWLAESSSDRGQRGSGAPRVLTLTGAGGSGKTRLVLEAARRAQSCPGLQFAFVGLADVRRDDLLLATLAASLGIAQEPAATLRDRVESLLNGCSAVLVLDNLEHVLDGAASLIRRLLLAVPSLRIVATSRCRLGITGEQVLPIGPLPVPSGTASVEDIQIVSSVQLFVDRAKLACATFQLTEQNAIPVAELCRRLEGIPLSLELAAARIAVLSPEQMANHVDGQLDLLVGRERDKEPRHRSMRAAIAWSYGLLTPDQQRFLRSLSAFRGGFTLEAVECVTASDVDAQSSCAASMLEDLVDASIVVADAQAGGTRFHLLEPVREFADDQLDADERSALWLRHAQCFLALAEDGAYDWTESWSPESVDRLDIEHGNVRAALDRMLGSEDRLREPDIPVGMRLAAATIRLWYVRGLLVEGRHWCSLALGFARSLSDEWLEAELSFCVAILALAQSDNREAKTHVEQSISLWRDRGDRNALAFALGIAGIVRRRCNDLEGAVTAFDESIALARESGRDSLIARTLGNYGGMLHHVGDLHGAREAFAEGGIAAERCGSDRGRLLCMLSLAHTNAELGNLPEARQQAEGGLRLARSIGDARYVAIGYLHLGLVDLAEGDMSAAREWLTHSLDDFLKLGDRSYIAAVLERSSQIADAEGNTGLAIRLVAGASAVRESVHDTPSPFEQAWVEKTLATLRSAVPRASFRTHWSRGRIMPMAELIAEFRREHGETGDPPL